MSGIGTTSQFRDEDDGTPVLLIPTSWGPLFFRPSAIPENGTARRKRREPDDA